MKMKTHGVVHGALLAALLAALAAGCAPPGAGDDAPTLGRSTSPVIDGAIDEATTAVVGMITSQEDGDHVCTGTLILPNLVLTARHCVAEAGVFSCDPFSAFGAAFPVASIELTTRTDVFGALELRAREIWTPDFALLCGGDQALVLLEGNVPADVAVPIAPRLDQPATEGEVFSAIGFGVWDPADPSDLGTRRRAGGFVVGCSGLDCGSPTLVAGEWMTSSGHCMGDSGGPALDAEGRVIGVVSRGLGACEDPMMSDPSTFAPWIRERAQAAATIGGYELPAWAAPVDPSTSASTGGETATTSTGTAGGEHPEDGGGGGPDDGSGGAPAGDSPSEEDDGGCTIGPTPPGGAWAWLPLAAVAVALTRRRGGARSRRR